MNNFSMGDNAGAVMVGQRDNRSGIKLKGRFDVICRDKYGNVKWRDYAFNKVVNQGIQYALDACFISGSQSTVWYLGLTDGTPSILATHTMSAHSGWTEVSDYTGNRKEWVEGRTAQTFDNSSNKATFTLDADGTTVGGCFLTDEDTGSTGSLFSGAAFSGGDKSGDSGDKLEVTYTIVGSDDTSS